MLLYDPNGKPISFYAVGAHGSELSVPFLRVQTHRLQETVARQILFQIRRQARAEDLNVVRITDSYLSPAVLHAVRDDGFLQHGGGWLALVIDACADSATIDTLTMTAAHLLDLRMPALRPQLSPVVGAGLERALWPAKITDCELPTFIVPIRPAWSAELFGIPQILMPRPNRLGISREHVYYRSPTPRAVRAPARLLWHVTNSQRGGLSAIVGCSRLEEVIVDQPSRLHARFRHLGVWQRHHVEAAARSGQALALRFADTELFPRQVSFQRLQLLAQPFGQRLPLRSPQKISAELFAAVYTEGQDTR